MREIGKMISQVSEISSSIAGAVEEQAAATAEVSTNINGVTEAAQASGSSASDVLGVAQSLSQQANGLQEQVDLFLAKVRAM
jgi:methyl-accepting chemotaxis protein